MGFADYFLIVADFMNFARGAANFNRTRERFFSWFTCGLLLYTLPKWIRFVTGLLFERFLNPERVSMPDIDIDFVDTEDTKSFNMWQKNMGRNM